MDTLVRDIPFWLLACARALATSLRRGGSAGRASVCLSISWTLHANLNVTPVLHELRLYVSAAEQRVGSESRFRPAEDSSHFLRSRCSLAIIAAGSLASRCRQHHGSAGAPRARWARPKLGRDPDETPDQHCEEWGGCLRDRAARRGRRPRTPQTKLHAIERARRRRSFVRSFRFNHHFSYSNPTAHFPSPAYGEARDGALATAPRGGNGGGAFSPFSVVVAVGP